MDKVSVLEFAKKQGYDGVKPLGQWRGYDIFEPTFDQSSEEEPAIVRSRICRMPLNCNATKGPLLTGSCKKRKGTSRPLFYSFFAGSAQQRKRMIPTTREITSDFILAGITE